MNYPFDIQIRPKGPKVALLGGGNGLSASIKSALNYASSVVGIVSVADDGGSSGRLRSQLGISPPGDFRKTLVALSSAEKQSMLFEYRFVQGELAGHPVGNLILAGLIEMTGQNLVESLQIAGEIVKAQGRILPAALEPVVLNGEVGDAIVSGQANLAKTENIKRIFFNPKSPEVPLEVLAAINAADQIVLGPGSLYTSVLAVAAIPNIKEALRQNFEKLIYVCNLRPQPGETQNYGVYKHFCALLEHEIKPKYVIYDPSSEVPKDCEFPELITKVGLSSGNGGHDPIKLASILSSIEF